MTYQAAQALWLGHTRCIHFWVSLETSGATTTGAAQWVVCLYCGACRRGR